MNVYFYGVFKLQTKFWKTNVSGLTRADCNIYMPSKCRWRSTPLAFNKSNCNFTTHNCLSQIKHAHLKYFGKFIIKPVSLQHVTTCHGTQTCKWVQVKIGKFGKQKFKSPNEGTATFIFTKLCIFMNIMFVCSF